MCRIDRIRNASLIQSVSGRHHVRERAPTGKEVSDDRRLLILKILDILDILVQTTESVGGHVSLLATAGGAVTKRAYRGVKGAVTKRAYRGVTGDLRARF